MTHSTRIIALALLAAAAGAQDYTYDIDTAPYVPLTGSRTVLFSGAVGTYWNQSTDVLLPFPVHFYGNTHIKARVATSGYISFPPETGTMANNGLLPDPSAPNDVIAAWWDNLEVANNGTSDEISYEVYGTPPSRRIVFQWRSMSLLNETPTDHHYSNFQIQLHETSRDIEVHYGQAVVIGSPLADYSASLGIENEHGTRGIAPWCGNPAMTFDALPPPDTLITYRELPAATYAVEVCAGNYQHLDTGRVSLFRGSINPTSGDSTDVPIGFAFDAFGQTHTTIRVSSNGYCTFPPVAGNESVNEALPSSRLLGGTVLAPWWDDLKIADIGGEDEVSYRIFGSPGTREFVAEWRSVSQRGDTATNYNLIYFQLRLHEDGDIIEMHYGNRGQVGTPLDFTATIGIQDPSGTEWHEPLGDSPNLQFADLPEAGTIITFTPQAPPPPVVTITTTSIPDAYAGEEYTASLTAVGGTPPFQWRFQPGTTLPAGLSLDTNGNFHGVHHDIDSYVFVVRIDDAAGASDTQVLTLDVVPFNPFTCGDCELDGDVDILDALAGAKHAAGLSLLTGDALGACDVNASGAVDVLDALGVAQNAAGLPVGLVCP